MGDTSQVVLTTEEREAITAAWKWLLGASLLVGLAQVVIATKAPFGIEVGLKWDSVHDVDKHPIAAAFFALPALSFFWAFSNWAALHLVDRRIQHRLERVPLPVWTGVPARLALGKAMRCLFLIVNFLLIPTALVYCIRFFLMGAIYDNGSGALVAHSGIDHLLVWKGINAPPNVDFRYPEKDGFTFTPGWQSTIYLALAITSIVLALRLALEIVRPGIQVPPEPAAGADATADTGFADG